MHIGHRSPCACAQLSVTGAVQVSPTQLSPVSYSETVTESTVAESSSVADLERHVEEQPERHETLRSEIL